ncbi:MAG: Ig-like domain-containing protein [Microgenomates group bacterium]
MRKENLLAIILGIFLGLVLTFGVWNIKKITQKIAPKTQEEIKVTQEVSPSPTPANKEEAGAPLLTILSPEENEVFNKEKIQVTGKAFPLATVVVLYEEGEKIVEADEEGNFSTEITLIGGNNEITISTYDEAGNEISKSLNVIYTSAEI